MKFWMLPLLLTFASPLYAQQQAQPPAEFSIGQKVMFEDVFMRAGGGWITGMIVQDLGIGCGCDRYHVKLDPQVHPAWQVQAFPASKLRPAQ